MMLNMEGKMIWVEILLRFIAFDGVVFRFGVADLLNNSMWNFRIRTCGIIYTWSKTCECNILPCDMFQCANRSQSAPVISVAAQSTYRMSSAIICQLFAMPHKLRIPNRYRYLPVMWSIRDGVESTVCTCIWSCEFVTNIAIEPVIGWFDKHVVKNTEYVYMLHIRIFSMHTANTLAQRRKAIVSNHSTNISWGTMDLHIIDKRH